jgi:four helix bundle protein
VLQEAHYLALELYRATESFPQTEAEGLQREIRAAGVTIAGKIARAFGVPDAKDRERSLRLALRSVNELDVRIEVAKDLQYMETASAAELLNQVRRMQVILKKLIYKLRARV